MKDQSIPLAPQMVREIVDELSAGLDEGCPLNDYAPSVFKCVRAKLEHQGCIAGGLQ